MLNLKKRPKKSLRRRLFFLINITILMVIGICILLNSLVFQKYYISQKTEILFDNLSDIEDILNEENTSSEDFNLYMERLCINSNSSVVVFSSTGDLVYTSVPENAYRFKHSPGIDFELDGKNVSVKATTRPEDKNRDILSESDDYVLASATINPLNTQVLELYSIIKGDYFVYIQTSMAPIRESVIFSNRFLITVGLMVWLIAAVIVTFLGNRLVKPIRRLSEISQRMAKMDFSQKYAGQTDDEVGMLGESINIMSTNLEKAISSLKAANAQLLFDIDKKEKIDKHRKEFISNVSHELKTPISIIEAYAEGLNEMELDADSRAYYCDVILDEARKMNTLIQKLMNLMRIESGSDKLDISRFDITEQIGEIIKQKSILAEQNEATIELETNEPIYVWADDFLVEDVFLNYFTNAIKYCGGEKKIKISIEKIGKNVRVNVFNTGEPLSDEVLENMWKSFYMADKARTRENGSRGLGLSIVAAIVKAHNHEYGAYNKENGVVFWFELDGDSKQE